MSKSEQQDTLADFMPWPQWVEAGHGGEVIKTHGQALWTIRKFSKKLIASGQLIPRRGPGGSLVGSRFGEVVLEALREDAVND